LAGKSFEEFSRLPTYEDLMGASLWRSPGLYLANSPIMRADRVKSPLLIFHCKADEAVPWAQGVEFFTALRRLGKKVWLLQYDEESHNLGIRENEKDLTIRITQFFDHYLKGAPAPKWMVEGVPARLKGIERGYEKDTSGREP
jgi:dipeptidyl aminopeptidase/acylaminoacyl peptidase